MPPQFLIEQRDTSKWSWPLRTNQKDRLGRVVFDEPETRGVLLFFSIDNQEIKRLIISSVCERTMKLSSSFITDGVKTLQDFM